jgi:hypothetical protein
VSKSANPKAGDTAARKEGHMASTLDPSTYTFTAKPATGHGDLDGHGFTCPCGSTQTTSLGEAEARRMARRHADWHRGRVGKVAV